MIPYSRVAALGILRTTALDKNESPTPSTKSKRADKGDREQNFIDSLQRLYLERKQQKRD